MWASWACGHGDANPGLCGAMLGGLGLMWAVGLHQQLQPSGFAPEPSQNRGGLPGDMDLVGCELGGAGEKGIAVKP